MNTRHCAYQRDKRGDRRAEGPAAIESLEPRLLLAATPQDIPLVEAFDAGQPAEIDGWDYFSFTGAGRIEVVSERLRMDVETGGMLNHNEATVHVNLAGLSEVFLQFDQAEYNDEQDPIWPDFFASTQGDGVAISPDGSLWHTVVNADELDTDGVMTTFVVDLDQAMEEARAFWGGSFVYTSNFWIRFQQYGDQTYDQDGREWDNIIIWPTAKLLDVSPSPNDHDVSADANVSATYNQNMTDASATDEMFVVHAMQTGQLIEPPNTISATGPTATLDPAANFHAGELVQATVRGGLGTEIGFLTDISYVWQFRAETTGGQSTFGGSWQDFGLSISNSADVALGDLDGDGDLDAFTANFFVSFLEPEGSAQPNKVWLNDGGGIFTGGWQQDPSAGPLDYPEGSSVYLGDLDGDGDLDAFVANYAGQPNKVWLNDGSGNFSDSGPDLGDAYSQDVCLGDLDADGDLDAFVANEGPNKVWFNDGAGGFSDSGQELGNSQDSGVSLGDLDGDGDLDAFVANSGDPDAVWLNDGSGVFTSSGQDLGGSLSSGVSLGDLNGDGHLDAFVANGDSQPNKVWLNDGNGDGLFTDSGQALGDSKSESVALGDLDGDGDLDAFVGNYYEQPDKIWTNNGTGTFTTGQSLGISETENVSLGDLDGDGDLDAFVATFDLAKEGGVDAVWMNGTPSLVPAAPDLVAGITGDTGEHDDDDLTYLDNSEAGKVLQFDVSGTIIGATVSIYADRTLIGSATATTTTTRVTTNGSRDLADGEHSITARQAAVGEVESGDSGALIITVDTAAPTSSVPDLPDLMPGSDTGTPGDDITNRDNDAGRTLDFEVTGTVAGAMVIIYADGVAISDAVEADDDTTLVTTNGSYGLADGEHSITARQTEAGKAESDDSEALTVTIDTEAPTLDKWSSAATHVGYGELLLEIADDGNFTEARKNGIQMLVLEFSEDVDLSGASVAIAGNNIDSPPPMDLTAIDVALAGRNPDPVFSDTGEIMFTPPAPDVGLPDVARYLVQLDGVVADRAGNTLTGDRDRIMTSLIGNMKGDNFVVDVRDLYWAWALKNQHAGDGLDHRRADMDLNGVIDVRDLYKAWAKKNNQADFVDPVVAAAAAPAAASAATLPQPVAAQDAADLLDAAAEAYPSVGPVDTALSSTADAEAPPSEMSGLTGKRRTQLDLSPDNDTVDALTEALSLDDGTVDILSEAQPLQANVR